MQKKNGISLIVLVITIIVMIILAGVIIIQLNSSGIIKKAEQAVEDTNIQEIRNLAALKWSEAYLKGEGKYTQSDLHREVMLALDKENLDLTPYDIKVTLKGVSVNRIQYYTTLGDAVNAVNTDAAGTITNVKKADAVAGIYIENGTPTVVLLKDTTETDRITLQKDMTVDLRGNKITFNVDVGLDTAKYNTAKIYIDGRDKGSEIYSETNDEVACAVQVRTGNNIKIEGVKLTSVSESKSSYAVFILENASVEIINCEIKSVTKAQLSNGGVKAYGINNNGDLKISNTTIFSDARGTKVGTDPISAGIVSEGKAFVTNCNVTGTSSGLSGAKGSETYISGGIFKSVSGGALFFSQGQTGKAYVDGAKISKCQYNGEFKSDFSNKNGSIGSLLIGINNSDRADTEVNINNCEIIGLDSIAIEFNNGTNDELYISNSTLITTSSEKLIKVDSNTNKIFIGRGCNFTANDTDMPSVVTQTSEVYTRTNN